MSDKKQCILERFLTHVPFDGWSRAALERAAQEVSGDARYASIYFSGGLADVAAAFAEMTDRGMKKELDAIPLKTLKIRERIAACVLARLRFMKPHKEAVRGLAGFLAAPSRYSLAFTLLARTADEIWHLAGDTSADFNYYTKRILLAGVYSSSLLYWLNDVSDNYKDTEAFLARRIADVMVIQTLRQKCKQ